MNQGTRTERRLVNDMQTPTYDIGKKAVDPHLREPVMGQTIAPSLKRIARKPRGLSDRVSAFDGNMPASRTAGQLKSNVSGPIQILLVEGDEGSGTCVKSALAAIPHECTHVRSGDEVFFLCATHRFDLMILDMDIPGRSGLEVLTALRRLGIDLPVLILSAGEAVEQRVAGLKLGTTDYITKPFETIELTVRLSALLHRGRLGSPDLRLEVHDLTLDVASRRVSRTGRALDLTVLEFDVLKLLMRRVRQVVSRETLVREVWGDVKRATPIDNLIDVHMGRLRKKIDLPGTRPLIHTVRGVGFVLSEKTFE
jgi:two-component system copper resistance phosphate regulon response regulator CusR